MSGHKATMLGTGLIGLFYTRTLHGQRNRDRVQVVYSRTEERARAFAEAEGVPEWTTDLEAGDRARRRPTRSSSACRTTCTRR